MLAAEYTDKFRAVFGFGAVDKIEYHNNSQFTFDTDNKPEIPLPVMQQCTMDELGISFSYPYLWDMEDVAEYGEVSYTLRSRYEGDNVWDMSVVFFDAYMPEENVDLQLFKDSYTEAGLDVEDMTIGGFPAMQVIALMENDYGDVFKTTFVAIQKDDILFTFQHYIYEDFGDDADTLFDTIIESITFVQ